MVSAETLLHVINIIPKPCKWSSVSTTITPQNSLWQFKTGVFYIQSDPCQFRTRAIVTCQTLSTNIGASLYYAQSHCKIFQSNNIDNMPQYPKTPHHNGIKLICGKLQIRIHHDSANQSIHILLLSGIIGVDLELLTRWSLSRTHLRI